MNENYIEKSWSYSEKTNKVETNHTISIKGNRFTHTAESKNFSNNVKYREDINLEHVYSVRSCYGQARNMLAVILLGILAAVALIASLVMFGDNDTTVVGVILILVAAGLGFLAYLMYKRIKPSFMLEINTVIPKGQLVSTNLMYGAPGVNFGPANPKNIFAVLFAPLLNLFKQRGRYRFEMDPATGNDIIDTIGEMLINK